MLHHSIHRIILLNDIDKSTPIYAYCTGGIRCVKVASYIKRKLGHDVVYRLKGGIVDYTQFIKNSNDGQTDTPLKSLYQGVNYVFDGRLVEHVTDDVLSVCHNCGVKCNVPRNCHYCNVSVVQFTYSYILYNCILCC